MFDPESGWGEVEWTGETTPHFETGALAMNASGTAAFGGKDEGKLWVAGYQPGGGWQAPVPLASTSYPLLLSRIVLDDGGDGLALFKIGRRQRSARLEDGVWQAPVVLEEDGRGSSLGDVAM